MEKENALLFVYGTLKRSFQNDFARRLRKEAEYIGDGYTFGKLFQIDWYPGLIKSDRPDEKVYGELYRLKNPAKSFIWLDEYEGCGKKGEDDFEYFRKIATCYIHGLKKDCWIYCFQGDYEKLLFLKNGIFN